ncbi:MAG: PEP-CTERM sorting domain-containing protein [Verrucomicrobiota bacterium]
MIVALFAMTLSAAHAVTFVLDDNNGRVVTIAPGLQLSQPDFVTGSPTRGAVSIIGGDLALGAPDVADFSSPFTIIGGGGAAPNPSSLTSNGTVFTIRDLGTGDLYEGVMTYYRSPRGANAGGVGTPPVPNNGASAVFELTLVPEPSALIFGFLALGALGFRRRR